MKGAKYKILNDFQASRIVLGTDYSYDYATDASALIYFYNDAVETSVITFKAFLESYSISFGVEFDEEDNSPGKSGKPKDFNCEYQINLNVPSISVNDSRVNAARFEELNIMMAPRTEYFSNGKPNHKNINLRVLMSNLINNGSYKEEHNINTPSMVKKYGIRGNIDNLSFNGIPESGFFEYGNKLFFKEYSIAFGLKVHFGNDDQISSKKYAVGFNQSSGAYDSKDIKTWPFGV